MRRNRGRLLRGGALLLLLPLLGASLALLIVGTPNQRLHERSLQVFHTERADMYLENGATPMRALQMAQELDIEVAAVEGALGVEFQHRPQLFLLRDTASYRRAVASIPGLDEGTIEAYVRGSIAIADPFLEGAIFDCSRMCGGGTRAMLRHELVHLLLDESLGVWAVALPQWFNEGLAVRMELSDPSSSGARVADRHIVAALAARHAVPALSSLEPASGWTSSAHTGEALRRDLYRISARASELLLEDIAPAKLPQLLAVMRGGSSLADAYQALAHQPYQVFTAGLEGRMLESESRPMIHYVTREAGRGEVVGWGLPAHTELMLERYGETGGTGEWMRTDGLGMLRVGFDLPAGAHYELRISARRGTGLELLAQEHAQLPAALSPQETEPRSTATPEEVVHVLPARPAHVPMRLESWEPLTAERAALEP